MRLLDGLPGCSQIHSAYVPPHTLPPALQPYHRSSSLPPALALTSMADLATATGGAGLALTPVERTAVEVAFYRMNVRGAKG